MAYSKPRYFPLIRFIFLAIISLFSSLSFISKIDAQTQPELTLMLSQNTIAEGSSTTLAVTVSPPSISDFEMEMELAEPEYLGGGLSRRATFADAGNGVSGSKLTLVFRAGDNRKQVTIDAAENDGVLWFVSGARDRYLVGGRAELSIRGRVVGGSGVVAPAPVSLFIEDDDASPGHCLDGIRPAVEADSGSWVNGDRIELVFDRDLKSGNAPTPVHFRPLAAGERVSNPRSKRVVV